MLPKIRCVVVSSLLLMMSDNSAWSAGPAGWGRVNMQGSIIETACAIDTQSRDQTIDMAVAPISEIARDGHGVSRPFNIRLVNCVLGRLDPTMPDWQRFQITFDGRVDSGGFGVEGEAQGVALQITDGGGNVASPGQAMPVGDITPGDKMLNYSLRLIGNNKILKPGEYYSTLRFKMDYY